MPSWAGDLLAPDRPGSLSHFYDAMSFGRLQVRGQVASRVYTVAQPASVYIAADPAQPGQYGRLVLEVLQQADAETDFARFDNDGGDGIPDSGDDGVVDALFLVLERVPARLLLGPATGIGNLGFDEEIATADAGASGQPIRIAPTQGTVQQGRTFSEAAGAICHEYGHVLGLSDLYDTAFLSRLGALPEEDSAGVGAWDLMGWGALGWNGDDGPNSLSAWSCVRLGWSEVIELTEPVQEVRLAPVGSGGAILQIPLTAREYYLLEYRTRAATWYDRDLPGEGLLVWHVERTLPTEGGGMGWVVDLECADGRYLDAGYPLGQEADAIQGGDNLDFWAHDPAYTEAHAGNLGDATDPFDGVRYRAFTPETNPASVSNDGVQSIRLTDLRFESGQAVVRVQAAPPLLQATAVDVEDDSGDGIAVAGEPVTLTFQLANVGGFPARQVSAVVRSADPQVEILRERASFADLEVGQRSFGALVQGSAWPAIRLIPGYSGSHTAEVGLDLYSGDLLSGTARVLVCGLAARQRLQAAVVVDSLGNRDGLPQAGEFFSLELTLADTRPELLDALRFSLRCLHPRVQAYGGSAVLFGSAGPALARSIQSPEFLLDAGLEAGSRLDFELAADSGFETWQDTVQVQVGPGADQTPPRITLVRSRATATGVAVLVADRWIQDGSSIRLAQARIYSLPDTLPLALVPLARGADGFEGVWAEPPPSTYLVVAEVEDLAGNQGRSRPYSLTVLRQGEIAPGSVDPAGTSDLVGLPEDPRQAVISGIAVAPSDPRVWYASTTTGLWRTTDQGSTWTRTGLMSNGLEGPPEIYIDSQDPARIFVPTEGTRILKSGDGGMHWEPVPLPVTAHAFRLIGIDPVRRGRLYGLAEDGHLFISEDEGASWEEVEYGGGYSSLVTHPADPRYILAQSGRSSDTLWCSTDDGEHWTGRQMERKFSWVSPDPTHQDALYGISDGGLWHSDDRALTWQKIDTGAAKGLWGVAVHPTRSGLIYVLTQRQCLVTVDGGRTWQPLARHGPVTRLVLSPGAPEQLLLEYSVPGEGTGWLQSQDFGAHLAPLALEERRRLAGTVVFTASGQPYIGSMGWDAAGSRVAGLLTSLDQGHTWEWQPATPTGLYFPTYFDAVLPDPVRPELIVGHYSGIVGAYMRSEDGGHTWRRLIGPAGYGFLTAAGWTYPQLLAVPEQEGLYYAGDDGLVWRSQDYGVTWEIHEPVAASGFIVTRPQGLAVDPRNPVRLYTSADEDLWTSDDGGQHWSPAGAVAPDEPILALEFYPSYASTLYAVTSRGIYRSGDAGATWQPLLRSEFGDWTNVRLRFSPADPSRIYLVTSRALYESRDAGVTWQGLDTGIGGYPWYFDVAVDPLAPEVLYVATTWGLYRAKDRDAGTAVESESQAHPAVAALRQNYPNPFNGQTLIPYQLPERARVELTLYNLAGQAVRHLVSGEQQANTYAVRWDGRDDRGRIAASGIYFCRLVAGDQVQIRRLMLLR